LIRAYTNDQAWDFIMAHYAYIKSCIKTSLRTAYPQLLSVGIDELLQYCVDKLHYNLVHRLDHIKTPKGFISFSIRMILLNYTLRSHNPDKKMLKTLNGVVLNTWEQYGYK